MSGRVSAHGAQARTRTAALRARLSKDSRAALGRRAGRIRLFPAVALALLAGLGVAFIAYGFLRWITPTSEAKAAPIDITRVALTVVAGVGGVVALVIAYRRQRDLEQSRFVERFGAAAAQLGATDVAVRIAGVYAMAGVADESEGPRRQQCIDVLCGYLRLPYTPDHGSSGRTRLVITTPTDSANTDKGAQEEHIEYRQNDREVRRTIVRVITARLRPTAEPNWSACNFDFRAAYLEDIDFSTAVFSGDALFGGATFSGTSARFDAATFSSTTRFDATTFSGDALFDTATFTGDAAFEGATFSGDAGFDAAAFSGDARFGAAMFSGDARFGGATFSSTALFDDGIFSGDALFDGARFSGIALFSAAVFSGDSRFDATTFSSTAGFGAAAFSGDARFGAAMFSDDAWFDTAMFSGDARFDATTFSGDARFGAAMFSGDARFDTAMFSGTTRFGAATFSGHTSFENVNFGAESISFVGPKQWGPPAPVFDWDHDVRQKPANVEPQDWPPVVAEPS
ncbi:pentapeptide repeat-containing protein [Nocardia xishanensis]